MPAPEDVLILYAAQLSLRLSHASIRTYFSAVRNLHIMHRAGDPLVGKLRLSLCLRGIKRMSARPGDRRLPITPYILSVIRRSLDSHPEDPDNVMFWAACCMGFFAFLRSAEFTVPSLSGFDPTVHLSPEDVATDSHTNPSVVVIKIKASKCDQFKQGVSVCVGRTNESICPVVAILTYCALRGREPGPFFRFQDGSPLTKPRLVTRMKSILQSAGVDPSQYSGHSFRIGAATTAASQGIPDSTIQTLGRWSSESFRRYIRLSHQELASFSRTLINTVTPCIILLSFSCL